MSVFIVVRSSWIEKGCVSWLELGCWHRLSTHLPWPFPATLASLAPDSCVKWEMDYKAGCKEPVYKFWLWMEVKKKLAWACSFVNRRGQWWRAIYQRRSSGCVQELEKEHFLKAHFRDKQNELDLLWIWVIWIFSTQTAEFCQVVKETRLPVWVWWKMHSKYLSSSTYHYS